MMNLRQALGFGSQAPVGDRSNADVYLSPHFDDVAFSLGSHAAHAAGGRLHTVFSRSMYLPYAREAPSLDGKTTAERIELISGIRQREDLVFATRVGLRAGYGGLDEAPVRGRTPSDRRHVSSDADQLGGRIVDQIVALHPGGAARPLLFAPSGIGGHLDHLIVVRAVLARVAELSRRYELLFYEDLHYSSNPGLRLVGLNRLLHWAGAPRAERIALPVRDPAEKIELIRIYRSQFRELPHDLSRHSPNLLRKTPPHEGVWRLEL
jgi:LmbE family N-acetylglucosaminyl deacetylase